MNVCLSQLFSNNALAKFANWEMEKSLPLEVTQKVGKLNKVEI